MKHLVPTALLLAACTLSPVFAGQNPLDPDPPAAGNPLDPDGALSAPSDHNPLDTAPARSPLDTGDAPSLPTSPAKTDKAEPAFDLRFEELRTDVRRGAAYAAVVETDAGALAVAKATLSSLAQQFGARPDIVSSLADKEDETVEAFFGFAPGGKAHVGRLSVRTVDRKTCSLVTFLEGSDVKALMKVGQDAEAQLPAGFHSKAKAGPDLKWQDVRFPDGSGTISLPDGYAIADANKGTVNIQGPGGAIVMLGVPEVIYTDASLNTAIGTRVAPAPGMVICELSHPGDAILRLAKIKGDMLRAANPNAPAIDVKIVEGVPMESPSGEAGMFLVDTSIRTADKTVKLRTLMYVACSSPDPMYWIFYTSGVTAPADVFADKLPEMVRIWGNWKVDQKVLLTRLLEANKAMAETTNMLIDVNTARVAAGSKTASEFDGYIVGSSPIVDPATGNVKHIDNRHLDEELQRMNQEAGYKKWVDPSQALGG